MTLSRRRPRFRFPSQLIFNVRENAGIARNAEVVRSGVPLPRSLNVLGTGRLAILDASGAPVPAEFEVTARWNAGKSDATAPVQWLLVTFPATVGANQTAAYRLLIDGSVVNPAPANPITLTQSGNAITVDTGAATFRLGSNPGALFDEVDLDNGKRLIGGSALSLQTGGSTYGHATTRRVWIEHQGPLTAIVVVQGAYDVPAIGGGQVSTRRRYVFTAGSPTAIVRHVTNWEGNLGCDGCVSNPDGTPNGVRIDKMRDDLAIEVGGTPTVTAVGNFSAPAVAKRGRHQPERLDTPAAPADPHLAAGVRRQRRRHHRRAAPRPTARCSPPAARPARSRSPSTTCIATSPRPSACCPAATSPSTRWTTRPGSPITRGSSPPWR